MSLVVTCQKLPNFQASLIAIVLILYVSGDLYEACLYKACSISEVLSLGHLVFSVGSKKNKSMTINIVYSVLPETL